MHLYKLVMARMLRTDVFAQVKEDSRINHQQVENKKVERGINNKYNYGGTVV